MNAVVKEATDVALVPSPETALAVFTEESGLAPYMAAIRAEIDSFVPDVTTAKGRAEIASMAHKISRSKTALDNIGKGLVAEYKEIPKKIDATRKDMRDTMDCWRDEVRAPLTKWEDDKEALEEKQKALLEMLRDAAKTVGAQPANTIREHIASVESLVIGSEMGDLEEEAHQAKAECLVALCEALDARIKSDAEQAELIELRRMKAEQEAKDRDARIAREAVERAAAEAEGCAKAEREAAAKREADLKLQAEQAEERAAQALRDARNQAEAAAAAERVREANRKHEEERATKAREADVAHKTAVLTAAKEAFMAGGFDEEQSRTIVRLIKADQIPGVIIVY